MRNNYTLPIYGITLLLSAFLIFSIQPLFSKMILPLLGGSSSVWNTAMVFFQAMLLAGYLYAHFSSKYLTPRLQVTVHIALLILGTIFLPLGLRLNTEPAEDNPVFWQLTLMLVTIGVPFLILSASAPLLQKWFAASNHKRSKNPYFLYALSNIGSLGALLAYPLVLEPLTSLTTQRYLWTICYLILIISTIAAGTFFWNRSPEIVNAKKNISKLTFKIKFAWIGYAFVPSSLLLGFTTLITTDLASAPLFWVIPLLIYLVTFIIAFSEKHLIGISFLSRLSTYAIIFLTFFFISGTQLPKLWMLIIYLIIFLIICQYCHSKLAKIQPDLEYLTTYYLLISLGGVLGGIFNALLAPKIFVIPAELVLPIIGVAWTLVNKDSWIGFLNFKPLTKLLTITIAPLLCGYALYLGDLSFQLTTALIIVFFLLVSLKQLTVFAWIVSWGLIFFPPIGWNLNQNILYRSRNYFGILTVYDQQGVRAFMHGGTLHGAQPKEEKLKLIPVSYYSPLGPIGDVFRVLSKNSNPQEVAVLGLGVGSVACFYAPNRTFDFYEIDPAVIEVANNKRFFSYLSDCGSPYRTILGDARLKILSANLNQYDLIFVDTFSSDNIPIHVMTKEAFQSYFSKLKKDGIIAMNISNRYLDLRPVLVSIAKELGAEIKIKIDLRNVKIGEGVPYHQSIYLVMSKSPEVISQFTKNDNWHAYLGEEAKAWTDDYANILGAFGNYNN